MDYVTSLLGISGKEYDLVRDGRVLKWVDVITPRSTKLLMLPLQLKLVKK